MKFLAAMLPTAARIPDAAMRDRFADRLAFKANVTDDVVRAKIREAAVQKQTSIAANTIPSFGHVTKAEKGLIWSLIHEPEAALAALADSVHLTLTAWQPIRAGSRAETERQ